MCGGDLKIKNYISTILASIGVQIEGDCLGLGTSLFSGKETLLEQLGADVLNNELQRTSLFYNKYLLNNENIVEVQTDESGDIS